ncbi:peptidylprolyl isomerase [soil metagenome]
MTTFTRRVAAALLTAGIAASAQAQAPVNPPLPAPTPPPAMAPVIAPPTTPAAPEERPTGVAAKVNGQDIPEVAVYRALRQFPVPEREVARKEILSHLIDNVIVDQYLTALKITAEPAEVDKLIEELKAELKKTMKDYAAELTGMMLTEAEFRAEVASQMKWDKFVKQQGTEEALKKLFDSSPNVFDGSMVRARHILLTPGTDPAKIEEAKKTLLAIKQTVEVEAKKIADTTAGDALAKETARGLKAEDFFGEYAKKYSTCPSKTGGGDLNFFPRVGAMVEPFAAAAFALNPYQMTEVIQTEFGYHLIMVTAKKAGTVKKFDEVKEDVRILYAIRMREAVLAQMKPKAQIVATPK